MIPIMTPEHKIFIKGKGFMKISDLKVGDELITLFIDDEIDITDGKKIILKNSKVVVR